MPKLDSKVENRQGEFLKNQYLRGDNAQLCKGGGNQDPQFFVGVVDDLQKKYTANTSRGRVGTFSTR